MTFKTNQQLQNELKMLQAFILEWFSLILESNFKVNQQENSRNSLFWSKLEPFEISDKSLIADNCSTLRFLTNV